MDGIEVVNVSYDPGDKRSTGELEYEVRTPRGTLRVHEYVGGGDPGVEEFSLDGRSLLGSGVDLPDADFPHYSDGQRAVARAQGEAEKRVLEAVTDWLDAYAEELGRD